jgi:hypothetical protein
MTVGTVKTQGSHLYFADESVSASDPELIKIACPTGVQGLGGAKDQIESTCLDTIGDKEYVAGLGNPGQVTVPFNLIPREHSHQILFTLKTNGETLHWILCLSDGANTPTIDTDGGITAPADRSSFEFDGYVADVNIDVATNEIVRGTLVIQRSGDVVFNAYTPA